MLDEKTCQCHLMKKCLPIFKRGGLFIMFMLDIVFGFNDIVNLILLGFCLHL